MTGGPYLLDTSTVIWALAEPGQLSPAAKKALRAGAHVLSVVSYWEVLIKVQKGRLAIADPVSWWRRATDLLGGSILSIRPAHVAALAGLPDLHRDPFDRMLLAQATAEGMTLLTRDRVMRGYAVRTLW